MKRPNGFLVLVAATLLGSLLVGHLAAQAPRAPAPQSGGAVALVDVNMIFNHHPRFKMAMEEMRTDVERAEASVQEERRAVQQLAEKLEKYKGTRDYRDIEQEIADRQTRLTIQVRRQQREFLEREARIYHNTYREIWQAVDYICRQYNIAVVLRFNRETADTSKPEEVLRDINKPVVWHRENLDITDSVLAEIVRDGPAPASPPVGHNPFQRPGPR